MYLILNIYYCLFSFYITIILLSEIKVLKIRYSLFYSLYLFSFIFMYNDCVMCIFKCNEWVSLRLFIFKFLRAFYG